VWVGGTYVCMVVVLVSMMQRLEETMRVVKTTQKISVLTRDIVEEEQEQDQEEEQEQNEEEEIELRHEEDIAHAHDIHRSGQHSAYYRPPTIGCVTMTIESNVVHVLRIHIQSYEIMLLHRLYYCHTAPTICSGLVLLCQLTMHYMWVAPPLHLTSRDCLVVESEYYQNCFCYHFVTSSMDTVDKNNPYSPVGP